MNVSRRTGIIGRRTILKAGATIAAAQVASPFIVRALGDTPVKIGLVDPFTGVYAAIAEGERVGAQLAAEQINKKGGILGRPLELLIEDFGERRRHRRAENAQADRTRSGELHYRRRQFRHRHRDGPGHQREKDPAPRFWRPHRSDHRVELFVECLPRLQLDHDGRRCHRRHADREARQEMVLSDAGLRLWALGAGELREAPQGRRRHFFRLSHTDRHARFLVVSDPGQGLRPASGHQRHGRRRSGQQPQAVRSVRLGQANGYRRHVVRT